MDDGVLLAGLFRGVARAVNKLVATVDTCVSVSAEASLSSSVRVAKETFVFFVCRSDSEQRR